MPLRIGNYGDWKGDKPSDKAGRGYHPPACTCYHCVEGRRRAEEKATALLVDAELRQRTSTPIPDRQPRKTKAPKSKNVKVPKPKRVKAPKPARNPRLAHQETGNLAPPPARVQGPDTPPDLSRFKVPDPARVQAGTGPNLQRRPGDPQPPRASRNRREGRDHQGGGSRAFPIWLTLVLVCLLAGGIYGCILWWDAHSDAPSSPSGPEPAEPDSPPVVAPAPTPSMTPTQTPTPASKAEPTATPFLRTQREFVSTQLHDLTQTVTELRATIGPAVIPGAVAGESPEALASSPSPTPAPSVADRLAEVSTTAMELANKERVKYGLPSLETSPKLVEIATGHSQDMADRGYFAHDSPDGDTFLDRYREAGYSCRRKGENIFQGWASNSLTIRNWRLVQIKVANAEALAAEAVEEWMRSPGHRANLLNPVWRQQGIGVGIGAGDKAYITHNFC